MTIPIIKPDNLIHYINYIHQHLRKLFVSYLKKIRLNIHVRRSSLTTEWLIDLLCLTPLPEIFQLYHGDDQF